MGAKLRILVPIMIAWPPLYYGTGGHPSAELDFVLFRQARFSTRCGVLGSSPVESSSRLQQTDERARHAVALEPSEQLLLAGWELHALQVPTHLGGQALPQEIHVPSPPVGRSLASW